MKTKKNKGNSSSLNTTKKPEYPRLAQGLTISGAQKQGWPQIVLGWKITKETMDGYAEEGNANHLCLSAYLLS